MKYMFMVAAILTLTGCKKDGNVNGNAIEYDTSLFGKTLTIYNEGHEDISYQYDELKSADSVTETGKKIVSGRYGCTYSGMCFKMGEFGFHSFCNGRRNETRAYTYYHVKPKVDVVHYGQVSLTINRPEYDSSTYTTLKRGSCN